MTRYLEAKMYIFIFYFFRCVNVGVRYIVVKGNIHPQGCSRWVALAETAETCIF